MNLAPVHFHNAARRELRRAVDRYDKQVPGLGDAFSAEVEHSVDLIATYRWSGSPHKMGTRRIQLRRFPYSPIYVKRDHSVLVVAVAHHRRRPEYWIRRIWANGLAQPERSKPMGVRAVDLGAAQAVLPELVREAERGEEVVLTGGGEPVARIVPIVRARGRRHFGSARGLIEIADDFDAPLEGFGE